MNIIIEVSSKDESDLMAQFFDQAKLAKANAPNYAWTIDDITCTLDGEAGCMLAKNWLGYPVQVIKVEDSYRSLTYDFSTLTSKDWF